MQQGKIILITGASSGFGRLAARMLLERGHTVLAAIRGGETRVESVLGSEKARFSDRLHAFDLHLEDPKAPEAAAAFVREKTGGRLDVLVNNAGYGLFGALEDQTPEEFRREFEVNFFGPVFLTRALLPALRESRGRIVNLSSIAGLYTFPMYGAYNASKYALEAISESLHYELKPFGVQVALVEPGGFRTDFNLRSKVFPRSPEGSPYRSRNEAMQKGLASKSGWGGNPERVARLIVRLCEKKRIPLRNPIGMDAGFMRAVSRVLPDRVRVAGTDWVFRKTIFKD